PLASSPTVLFFVLAATATLQIYTLSLHDALPISARGASSARVSALTVCDLFVPAGFGSISQAVTQPKRIPQKGAVMPSRVISETDRKSTRLNSSHVKISYAVFCLKKKKRKAIN